MSKPLRFLGSIVDPDIVDQAGPEDAGVEALRKA
jgi:hypothetical protein